MMNYVKTRKGRENKELRVNSVKCVQEYYKTLFMRFLLNSYANLYVMYIIVFVIICAFLQVFNRR